MTTINQISSFGLHYYQNSSIAQKVCFVPALEMGARAAVEGIKILFNSQQTHKKDRDISIIKFGYLATVSVLMGLSALHPVSSVAASINFVVVSTILSSKGKNEASKDLPFPITMKLAGVIGSCCVSLVKKIQSAGLRIIKALQNGISAAGKMVLKGLRFIILPFKVCAAEILKNPKVLFAIIGLISTSILLRKISNMALLSILNDST